MQKTESHIIRGVGFLYSAHNLVSRGEKRKEGMRCSKPRWLSGVCSFAIGRQGNHPKRTRLMQDPQKCLYTQVPSPHPLRWGLPVGERRIAVQHYSVSNTRNSTRCTEGF